MLLTYSVLTAILGLTLLTIFLPWVAFIGIPLALLAITPFLIAWGVCTTLKKTGVVDEKEPCALKQSRFASLIGFKEPINSAQMIPFVEGKASLGKVTSLTPLRAADVRTAVKAQNRKKRGPPLTDGDPSYPLSGGERRYRPS